MANLVLCCMDLVRLSYDGPKWTEICRNIPCDMGTAVAQWLRCCVTNRKVAGSILGGHWNFSMT